VTAAEAGRSTTGLPLARRHTVDFNRNRIDRLLDALEPGVTLGEVSANALSTQPSGTSPGSGHG
jgi:hypothetical protein